MLEGFSSKVGGSVEGEVGGVCGRFIFLCPAGFSKFIIWFVRRKYKKIKIGIPINKRIPKITGLDMYTMR